MLSKDQTPSGWQRHESVATVEKLDDSNGTRTAVIHVRMPKSIVSVCQISDIHDDEWAELKKAYSSPREKAIAISYDRCVAVDHLCHLHFVHFRAI